VLVSSTRSAKNSYCFIDNVGSYSGLTNFFRSPFTYYQQALNAVESATRQGLETFQTATETFQKSTRQGLDTLQSYTHQAQNTTQKASK